MGNKIKKFEDLIIWQKADEMSVIYNQQPQYSPIISTFSALLPLTTLLPFNPSHYQTLSPFTPSYPFQPLKPFKPLKP